MRKKAYIIIAVILIIAIAIFILKNMNKEITIDIDKLSENIIKNVDFEDEMNITDAETVKRLYNIDNAISEKVYLSSGATAEEVAIFEFENKENAKEAVAKVNERIENQKSSYSGYAPKEVKRLEDAILIQKDKYIVFCVTEDKNAQKLISEYME